MNDFNRLYDSLDKIDGRLDHIDGKLDKYTERLVRVEEKQKSMSGQIKTVLAIGIAIVTALVGGAVDWAMSKFGVKIN